MQIGTLEKKCINLSFYLCAEGERGPSNKLYTF